MFFHENPGTYRWGWWSAGELENHRFFTVEHRVTTRCTYAAPNHDGLNIQIILVCADIRFVSQLPLEAEISSTQNRG